MKGGARLQRRRENAVVGGQLVGRRVGGRIVGEAGDEPLGTVIEVVGERQRFGRFGRMARATDDEHADQQRHGNEVGPGAAHRRDLLSEAGQVLSPGPQRLAPGGGHGAGELLEQHHWLAHGRAGPADSTAPPVMSMTPVRKPVSFRRHPRARRGSRSPSDVASARGHLPSLRCRCSTAARISSAFHAVQSLLCGNRGTPALRPAATMLTASRSEPCCWHTARNLVVKATDGSSFTPDAYRSPAATSSWHSGRGAASAASSGVSQLRTRPVRYDVIRTRPHAWHTSASQSFVERSRASCHACPAARRGHGGTW